VKAAHDLQPIWSQPAEKVVSFADSWTAARTDFATVLGELGLTEPKELLK
jgi:propane monooxygenase small subunit